MRVVSGPWGSFKAWDGDTVSHTISTGQFWDQQIQPFLDEPDPTGWAIDLGANIGWFTVYLAKRYAHVLAVEAHPETFFKLLSTNVFDHGVAAKTTLVYGAAYDRLTTLRMAPAEWLGWPIPSETDLDLTPGSASLAFVPNRGLGLEVPTVVVDQILAGFGYPRVTCIKVDCQGADLRALKGLRETISRDRPLIIFELEYPACTWHGDEWLDYTTFFAELNYSITQIRSDLGDYVARPL